MAARRRPAGWSLRRTRRRPSSSAMSPARAPAKAGPMTIRGGTRRRSRTGRDGQRVDDALGVVRPEVREPPAVVGLRGLAHADLHRDPGIGRSGVQADDPLTGERGSGRRQAAGHRRSLEAPADHQATGAGRPRRREQGDRGDRSRATNVTRCAVPGLPTTRSGWGPGRPPARFRRPRRPARRPPTGGVDRRLGVGRRLELGVGDDHLLDVGAGGRHGSGLPRLELHLEHQPADLVVGRPVGGFDVASSGAGTTAAALARLGVVYIAWPVLAASRLRWISTSSRARAASGRERRHPGHDEVLIGRPETRPAVGADLEVVRVERSVAPLADDGLRLGRTEGERLRIEMLTEGRVDLVGADARRPLRRSARAPRRAPRPASPTVLGSVGEASDDDGGSVGLVGGRSLLVHDRGC